MRPEPQQPVPSQLVAPPSHLEEPPPPPQPPYAMHNMGTEEVRSGVRLERDRERRSIRKLTKDSGYETSQYAESDYANLDWDSEQASEAAISDRSPTNKSNRSPSEWGTSDADFSPRSSGIYSDLYSGQMDSWRNGQQPLYWSSHGSTNSSTSGKPVRPSNHHPTRHRDSWEHRNWGRSSRGYSSGEEKPTSPIGQGPLPYSHHRKTSSYNSHQGRSTDTSRTDKNLGRYSSTDSLNSYSSSILSYPPPSVLSAKSTPTLCQELDLDDRRPLPPIPSHALCSSRSTPNLEDLEGEGMVTRQVKKSTSVYDSFTSKAIPGTDFKPPMVQQHSYWEDEESRDEYEAQVRLAAFQAYQVQHSRQISNQSSCSDRTSSSCSVSQHSRQLSSQSSFSEEDFRIQSIKEEFHQRTQAKDYYQGQQPPPYSHKYYSSDNLALPYDQEEEPPRPLDFQWNKSQPDLQGSLLEGERGRMESPVKSPTSPPPPPTGDSSSLKYNKTGNNHEKFPSWPVMSTSASSVDGEYLDVNGEGGSANSSYPRSSKRFTQNLKTVIEKAERHRPEEGFSGKGSYNVDLVYTQHMSYYYHAGKDAPSPPVRDVSYKKSLAIRAERSALNIDDDDDPPPPYSPTGKSSNSQFCHSHSRSQDQGYWSPDCKEVGNKSDRGSVEQLAEEGREEMEDGTPLMDRLRRESLGQVWPNREDGLASTGRESVTSSNSSQETLKWHGSNSDVSVHSERARGGVEAVVHSAKVQQPQRHNSESVLYYGKGQAAAPASSNKQSKEHSQAYHCQPLVTMPKKDDSRWSERVHKNNVLNAAGSCKNHKVSNNSKHVTPMYACTSFVSTFKSGDERRESLAREEFRTLPAPEYAKPLSVAERIKDIERHARSGNTGQNSRSRPPAVAAKKVSKTPESHCLVTSPTFPQRKGTSGSPKTSSNSSLIEDRSFEDGSPDGRREHKTLYLDPEKKHRVSDPELKAFQKLAVLSFFERQTAANGAAGLQKRTSQSLPRDALTEFKYHVANAECLERVPECPGSAEVVPIRPPPRSTSLQPRPQRLELGTENKRCLSAHLSPTRPQAVHRPVPVKHQIAEVAACHRVAIFYNTYTQTNLVLRDLHQKSSLQSDLLLANNVVRERFMPFTSPSSPSTADDQRRPRKDVSLQTEWPWQSQNYINEAEVQDQKTNSTGIDQIEAIKSSNSPSEDKENVSVQLLNRLTGSSPTTKGSRNGYQRPLPPTPSSSTSSSPEFNNKSTNNKNSNYGSCHNVGSTAPRTPPERPPKRPHLQRASSPPPLLPRRLSPSGNHQRGSSWSPPPSNATLPVFIPPPPPPSVPVDEEHELVRIEQSAQELRDLMRSSSPDLPLPPPPPTADEDEVVGNDEPLPPPPTPNEVKQMLPSPSQKSLASSAGSPPLNYPKNSYMSYRNERHPGRLGFDGNYHRSSSSGSSSESEPTTPETLIPGEEEANMDPVTTSLTPTAWEKWHNIGRPGATVVFTSNDLRPSGALKQQTNEPVRKKSASMQAINVASNSTGEHHYSDNNNEERGRIPTKSRRVSLDKERHLQQASLSSSRNSISEMPGNERLNGGGVSPKLLQPSVSNSSLETGSDETNESPIVENDSLANQGDDQRNNKNISPSLEQKQSPHLQEVMTQTTPSIARLGRVKHKEEFVCEQLTHDLVSSLPDDDKVLQALLVPRQHLKTTADYMEGIFETDQNKETPVRKICFPSGLTPPSSDKSKRSPEVAPLPADSAYFTTSDSKAKFLTRYRDDMKVPIPQEQDGVELGRKKEELIKSISRKLEILKSEQLVIVDEISGNEELGKTVTSRVEKLAKPNEIDKYKFHVDDIDKITNLLLSLSGRLARAENALMGISKDANQHERETLEAKRDKLFEQHEEAKKIKENIDRRSVQVSKFLQKYLSSEEYADYDHFIKMKSKLLMDSREIDEKIKLGEEQMKALTDSLTKQN